MDVKARMKRRKEKVSNPVNASGSGDKMVMTLTEISAKV
jgi:hypothetical protein